MYSYPSPAGGIQIVHPMEMFLKQIDRTSFQHFFAGCLTFTFRGQAGPDWIAQSDYSDETTGFKKTWNRESGSKPGRIRLFPSPTFLSTST